MALDQPSQRAAVSRLPSLERAAVSNEAAASRATVDTSSRVDTATSVDAPASITDAFAARWQALRPRAASNDQTNAPSQPPETVSANPALRETCDDLHIWGQAIEHGALALAIGTGAMLFWVGFFGHPLAAVLGIPLVFVCVLLSRAGHHLRRLGVALDPKTQRSEISLSARLSFLGSGSQAPSFGLRPQPPKTRPGRAYSDRFRDRRDTGDAASPSPAACEKRG